MDLEKEYLPGRGEIFLSADAPREERCFADKLKIKSININSDFKRAYFRGIRKLSGNMVLYVRRVFSSGLFYGITTSKKVGCAVERNRARRLIREALFSLNLKSQGYHIVFVARRSILKLKMYDVQREIRYLLGCVNVE